MKNEQWEHDAFDELLRDALASDAAPSDDFTERLMEQVRRTPQQKPLKKQPWVKLLAALAACAVIVAAIPLVRMSGGMGSAAHDATNSMDCAAAPSADTAGGDDANGSDEPMQQFMVGAAQSDGENDDSGSEKLAESRKNSEDALLTDQELTLVGQSADEARAALDTMGIQPMEETEGRVVYVLTAEQAAQLGESVDALYGIEGSLCLTLEAAG